MGMGIYVHLPHTAVCSSLYVAEIHSVVPGVLKTTTQSLHDQVKTKTMKSI